MRGYPSPPPHLPPPPQNPNSSAAPSGCWSQARARPQASERPVPSAWSTLSGGTRYRLVRIGECCWNSVNLYLLAFQRWNPAPKLADRWKSSVWLGRSDLTDEHLVRTKELETREAYDDSPSTAGRKKTSVQLSKHHRSRSRQQWTSLLQPNLSLFLWKHQKYPKTRRRNPKQNLRKTQGCRGSRRKQR